MADTIKCSDSLVLPFSATFIIPASYNYVKADKFSIAVNTDNLIVYKEIVEVDVDPPVIGSCDMEVQGAVKAKLGQIKVSGSIVYRVAANGIKSDPLKIPVALQDKVNVGDNMWSSADGFVEVVDGENNYITVGFTLPDDPLVIGDLTVELTSLVSGTTVGEDRSNDTIVTLEGEFTLSYTPA